MKQKIYTFLIALAALAVGASASAQTYYGVSIFETKITSANKDDVTGPGILGGTISFNNTTKTLTLNNVTISGAKLYTNAISAEVPITIKLIGTSNITATTNSASEGDVAVYFNNEGVNTITGTGTLNIINQSIYTGLLCDRGTLNITGGCTVKTEGGHSGVTAKKLTVDNSTLHAKGKTYSSVWCTESLSLVGAVTASPQRTSYSESKQGIIYNETKELVVDEWVEIKPGVHYNIRVAGIRVTSVNASGITGTGITGTVSFNPTSNTLKLSSATIDYEKDYGISSTRNDLKIELVGTNKINTSMSGIYLGSSATIMGAGSLSINSGYAGIGIYNTMTQLQLQGGCTVIVESSKYSAIYGLGLNNKLIIDNATLRAKGHTTCIRDIAELNLTGCEIITPQGAYFDSGLKGVAKDGALVTNQWVEIKPVTYYNLSIAGTKVHSGNASSIIGDGISGSVSYTKSTHTLKLSDATITVDGNDFTHGIDVKEDCPDNLKIELVGTNHIKSTTGMYGMGVYLLKSTTFTGSGSLDIKCVRSQGIYVDKNLHLTIANGCSLTVESESNTAVRGMSGAKLTVDNATLKAKGGNHASIGLAFASLTLDGGCFITSPAGAIFHPSLGGVALNIKLVVNQWVEIKPVTYYNLKVANIPVHSDNESEITGPGITAGKISYAPSTRTLTLDNAELEGRYGIYSEVPITIDLIGTSKINSALEGVWLEGSGNNVIQGSGTLNVKAGTGKTAVCNYNTPLTISGGCTLIAEGHWGLGGYYANTTETLTVNNATVKAKGTESSISYLYDLTLIDCEISVPEGAKFDNSLNGIALNGALVGEGEWVEIIPTGTGLESLTSQGIRVWGDKGVINILLPDFLKGEFGANVQVYDLTGSLVRTVPLGYSSNNITVDNIPAGIYMVKIGDAAEKVIVR